MKFIYTCISFFSIIRDAMSFPHGKRSSCSLKNVVIHSSKRNLDEFSIPLNSEPPLRIALLVEPTPFNYISGYSNRFKEMLKFLHKAGDKVHILTPDDSKNPPKDFMGFNITTVHGFRFPFYNAVTLSFDIEGKTADIIKNFKPDLIHVASPGSLVFTASLFAKKYNIPLVMSYHTNFPKYCKVLMWNMIMTISYYCSVIIKI